MNTQGTQVNVETTQSDPQAEVNLPTVVWLPQGDYARGLRTLPRTMEGPDYARGLRTLPRTMDGPE